MEKRVVVIHRLHQILEPFMLRRQVGWGQLPAASCCASAALGRHDAPLGLASGAWGPRLVRVPASVTPICSSPSP